MGASASELLADFYAEIGGDLKELVTPERVLRWLNQGQSRLPRRAVTETVNWSAGDRDIQLPSDFIRLEGIELDESSGCLPAHRVWGDTLHFTRPADSAGSGILLYWGDWPTISNANDSFLPQVGNQGLVSYALYRFFKTLASSRADFRRYATISQANGVDISELDALSERHLADFQDSAEEMNVQDPSSFFGD